MDVNYMHPEIKDFMEICNPPVNEPVGSYQIHHLNLFDAAIRKYLRPKVKPICFSL